MAFDRDEFYREVGLRIQLARKRKRSTQEDVAVELGIPRATYANVESGRQRVSLDVVWKIAAVLQVPLDSLVPEPIRTGTEGVPIRLPGASGTAWLSVASNE